MMLDANVIDRIIKKGYLLDAHEVHLTIRSHQGKSLNYYYMFYLTIHVSSDKPYLLGEPYAPNYGEFQSLQELEAFLDAYLIRCGLKGV